MRKAKVDANQKDITKALRAIGATVKPLHMVGGDFPDLAVGYEGINYLLEVKDGNSKNPARRKLSKGQEDYHEAWQGQMAMVRSVDEALLVIAGLGNGG